jgi:hypothetical protein
MTELLDTDAALTQSAFDFGGEEFLRRFSASEEQK